MGRVEIPLPRTREVWPGGGWSLGWLPKQTCIIALLYFQSIGERNQAEFNSEPPIQGDCLSAHKDVQIGWKKMSN